MSAAVDALDEAMRGRRNVDLALLQTNVHLLGGNVEKALQSLQKAKRFDRHPVTGLPLRRGLIERWEATLRKAVETPEPEHGSEPSQHHPAVPE